MLVAAILSISWIENQDSKKKTWEYQHWDFASSQDEQFQKMLAEQGANGWELVAVDRETNGGRLHFYLKRAK